jgi:hypothetical protein
VAFYLTFDGLVKGVAIHPPGYAINRYNKAPFVEIGLRLLVEIHIGGFQQRSDGGTEILVFVEPDFRPDDGSSVWEERFKPLRPKGIRKDAFGGIAAAEVYLEGFFEAAVLVEFEHEVVVAVVFVEGLAVPRLLELLEEVRVSDEEGAKASLEGMGGIVGEVDAYKGPFPL